MMSSFVAALIGGATCGLLLKPGTNKLSKKLDSGLQTFSRENEYREGLYATWDERLASVEEKLTAAEESIKRLDLFDESVASITSRLEGTPTRKEVADAFRVAAELEEQRRSRTEREKAEAAEAAQRAEREAQQAAAEEARQAALVEEWAQQQRELIRQEVEQEIAVELERRAQQAVATNPLNARPAAMPTIEPPAGFEQVNRNRFARPLLGDPSTSIPDPFLTNEND